MLQVYADSAYGCFFFFKQKTAYEMRISDWSSDVGSSDLRRRPWRRCACPNREENSRWLPRRSATSAWRRPAKRLPCPDGSRSCCWFPLVRGRRCADDPDSRRTRSEEHTSELQSLMRISYAVFCLKKKKQNKINIAQTIT